MKKVIGMVHLKALPTAPQNVHTLNEIYEYAYEDLKKLEENGYKYAIVENMFDDPYTQKLSLDIIVSYTKVFTRLKSETTMILGVNLHNTNNTEEMLIAHYCDADFIRVENMLEHRFSGAGVLPPLAPDILREKKRLNSNVKILADVNVKETVELIHQKPEEIINKLESIGVDGVIVSGLETGKTPSLEEVQTLRTMVRGEMFIGSGVNESNISSYLEFADGVIVGSSIKEGGKVSSPVSKEKSKRLLLNSQT